MAADVDEPPCAEHQFSCHKEDKKKDKKNISTCYVCIVCGSIYHRSCAERKGFILLRSSFVICCEVITSQDFDAREFINENKIKRLANEVKKSKMEYQKLKDEMEIMKNKYAKFELIVENENLNNSNLDNPSGASYDEISVYKITNKYLHMNNKELLNRIDDLKESNFQLKEINTLLKEKTSSVAPTFIPSFSEIVTQSPTIKNVPSIVIKTDNNVSVDDSFNNVKKAINKQKNIKINSCFKTNKNIIVKCNSDNDNYELLKLINNNKQLQIKAEIEKLKNPLLKVVGINPEIAEMSNDEIVQDLMERNDLTADHLINFKVKFKHKSKNVWNLILEVNNLTYDRIMKEQKIHLASGRYNVYNDFNISLCTKCCKYGHTRKKCKNDNLNFCTYCAGSHLSRDCRNQEEKQCKICCDFNSKHTGDPRNTKHSCTEFQSCPSYNMLLKNIIKSTDYPHDPLQYES